MGISAGCGEWPAVGPIDDRDAAYQASRKPFVISVPSCSNSFLVAATGRVTDLGTESHYFRAMFGGCFPTERRTVLRLTNASRFRCSRSTVARPVGVLPMISVNPALHAK